MNCKEALHEMKRNKPLRVFGTEGYCDAYDMAIEALTLANKYRRHDIRKNPEDLPEANMLKFSHDCVVYLSNGEVKIASHQGGADPQIWVGEYVYVDVIAWRYIQPFEGCDEE